MGVRKNAATLTPDEKRRFMQAVLELKKTVKPGHATNIYDEFVAIHYAVISRNGQASGDGGHGGPAFLAWHREYILRFEQELKNVDSTVDLPYWRWESGNPADTDNVFTEDFLGPMGNSGSGRVTSGYLAENPNSFNPDGWRIDSRLDQGNRGTSLVRNTSMGSLPSAAANAALSEDDFHSFRPALEAPHGTVHVRVGGHMGVMTSPNDPIFFLHHANVDRLWAKWQLTHPGNTNYNPNNLGVYGHRLDDPMWPWDEGESGTNISSARPLLPSFDAGDVRRPRDVLDISTLGYSYDDVAPPPPANLSPPTNFNANATSSSQINLSWGQPTNTGGVPVANFSIRRRTASSSWSDLTTLPGTSTSFSDSGLSSGTRYFYEIRAANSVGTSNPATADDTTPRCFIATAAYGSELEPPVQFLREFRDNVVLKSRLQKPFEDVLDVYYKFSPPIANLMSRNKPFKYTMKYAVVWPFVALVRAAAFLVEPFVDDNKDQRHH